MKIRNRDRDIYADTNRATQLAGAQVLRHSAKLILLLFEGARAQRENQNETNKNDRINAICILCKHLFVPIRVSLSLPQLLIRHRIRWAIFVALALCDCPRIDPRSIQAVPTCVKMDGARTIFRVRL